MKKGFLFGLFALFIGNANAGESELFGELVDSRDGNKYLTSKLNGYEIMAENLRYNRGDASLYCSDNDAERIEYGCYYSADQGKKACPENWRLIGPNDRISLELLALALRHYAGFYAHPVLKKIGFTGPFGLLQRSVKGHWWVDYPYDEISVATLTKTSESEVVPDYFPPAHIGASVICVRNLN